MRLRVNRREFLNATAVVTAAVGAGLAPRAAQPAAAREPREPVARPDLVDVNVTLSHWPGRRLPLDEAPALVKNLRSQGVTQAWAGTFDGLFHNDIAAVNARLARECQTAGRGILVPFGSVNPKLAGWENHLRRCAEPHRMPGIRLHPNYHRYTLDDPVFAKLLNLADDRGLIVQLVVGLEDERVQHPPMRGPHADVKPLLELLKTRPNLRIVLLNWSRGVKSDLLPHLAKAGRVYFEIATVEGVGGVATLARQVPLDRVLFGSCAPFFYFESALLKLKESELAEEQSRAIRGRNAGRLLNSRT